ncbi:MAG: glycosyltransferase [Streptococcus sp.]
MNNSRFIILIPVYNVENYLRRGLDSIFLQPSSITYEILLIDDGSSDKSGTICDEYQKNFRMFLLVTLKTTEWQKLGI